MKVSTKAGRLRISWSVWLAKFLGNKMASDNGGEEKEGSRNGCEKRDQQDSDAYSLANNRLWIDKKLSDRSKASLPLHFPDRPR